VNKDAQWQADQFERHRARLRSVAYRMLGSLSDADDAVQETWLRLNRSSDDIDNLGGWLTTVIGRVCVDMLRARYARREQLVGTWLPEPIVTIDTDDDPEQQSLLADSVGLALLVVLDTLSPAERLAFVLHDMFGVPFDQIAPIVDRSPDATRQLASRARRRVRGSSPVPDADIARQQAVVEAFIAAARAGDFARLVELLHPDVVFRVDAGRRAAAGALPQVGVTAVARQAAAQGPRFAKLCRPAVVNGAAGILMQGARGPIGVAGVTVVADRIAEIDLIIDPDKIARLRFVTDSSGATSGLPSGTARHSDY
jgi:RNA polymerase sigma-70 factor (ECF subfamily)